MTATSIVNKLLDNSIRTFKNNLTWPQYKTVRRFLVWAIENKTTVVQHMHKASDKPSAPSLRESISYNLWKMEIEEIVQNQAARLIKKASRYKWKHILSWDGTDVFKPAAKKMQNLKVIKDWSTGLFGNGYQCGWININGITHQFHVKDPNIEYIWDERWKEMLEKSFKIVDPEETITIRDRGHDSVWFIDMLYELNTNFVIRAKKNRILTVSDWEKKKCEEFECWVYEVQLEVWTHVNLYVVQVEWYDTPIRIYSNMMFESIKEVVELYRLRWKIELDFKKMKSYGLEKARLMSFKKIQNICYLIQFLIVLWQKLYNEISGKMTLLTIKTVILFKKFAKEKWLKLNPMSVLRFVSEYLEINTFWKSTAYAGPNLFGHYKSQKKIGLI